MVLMLPLVEICHISRAKLDVGMSPRLDLPANQRVAVVSSTMRWKKGVEIGVLVLKSGEVDQEPRGQQDPAPGD